MWCCSSLLMTFWSVFLGRKVSGKMLLPRHADESKLRTKQLRFNIKNILILTFLVFTRILFFFFLLGIGNCIFWWSAGGRNEIILFFPPAMGHSEYSVSSSSFLNVPQSNACCKSFKICRYFSFKLNSDRNQFFY